MASDQQARRLLREFDIQHLCDVDLLVFFARHPRALLSSEQLAGFTGYNLQQIAESLEALVRTGFLSRTAHATHAARMYVFSMNGPSGDLLASFLQFVSTRDGRLAVKRAVLNRSAVVADSDVVEDGAARPHAGTRPKLVRPAGPDAADDAAPTQRRRVR
jgi:hypothetical protein